MTLIDDDLNNLAGIICHNCNTIYTFSSDNAGYWLDDSYCLICGEFWGSVPGDICGGFYDKKIINWDAEIEENGCDNCWHHANKDAVQCLHPFGKCINYKYYSEQDFEMEMEGLNIKIVER